MMLPVLPNPPQKYDPMPFATAFSSLRLFFTSLMNIVQTRDTPVDVQLTGAKIYSGSGTPEGVITAIVGSLFLRLDGGAVTTLYVKTTGIGNTGWTAK